MDTVEPCRRIRKWQLSFNLYILYIYIYNTHTYIYYIIYHLSNLSSLQICVDAPNVAQEACHSSDPRRWILRPRSQTRLWTSVGSCSAGVHVAEKKSIELFQLEQFQTPQLFYDSWLMLYGMILPNAFGISMDYHKLRERTAAGTSCWLSYQLPVLADSWWQGQLGASPKFG